MSMCARGSSAAIADRYIARDGGPPHSRRWKRPGRFAGEIVTAESIDDLRYVASFLFKQEETAAFEAFARLLGVSIEDLQLEARSPS